MQMVDLQVVYFSCVALLVYNRQVMNTQILEIMMRYRKPRGFRKQQQRAAGSRRQQLLKTVQE